MHRRLVWSSSWCWPGSKKDTQASFGQTNRCYYPNFSHTVISVKISFSECDMNMYLTSSHLGHTIMVMLPCFFYLLLKPYVSTLCIFNSPPTLSFIFQKLTAPLLAPPSSSTRLSLISISISLLLSVYLTFYNSPPTQSLAADTP